MTTDHILISYATIRLERKTKMERFRDWYWGSDAAKAMTASGIVGVVFAIAFIYALLANPGLQLHY